ncbi:MAG: geranylgeranylglycerol-phosphate geranylgeranyltransferase, partial [Thermoplasmatales archaeon]
MISNYNSKLIALILSIRPETTPLGMVTVYIGGLVAGAPFNSIPLLLAVVVTFFITAGSMTFNDAYDWEIDAVNHPNRPIPKGIITPKQMLQFTAFLFTIGLIITFFINFLCTGIYLFSIGFLAIYELFTKKYGIMGNITVAFVSSMAFTFGGAAVGNPYPTLPLTILGFLIVFGREILMDIRDAHGDKQIRLTLPNQIGIRNASFISSILLLLAIAVSPLPYILNIVSLWYIYFIIPVDIITIFTVIWFLKDHQNAAVSAHIIRGALALGLIGF